ncbi:MAG: ABC transporter ATP-binding protein [Dehalococcoidia bacterium]
MEHIARIIGYAFRHRMRLVIAYLCTAGAVASYVVLPRYFGKAIDAIAIPLERGESVNNDLLVSSIVIIVVLSLIRGVLSYGQTYLAESLSQFVSYDLRNDFYDKVQHQSFAFHDKHHTGNLMSRAITDVENIRMFINMGVVRSPYFISLFVIVAVILTSINWQLGLISAGFMPIVAFYTSHVRLKMRNMWLISQQKMAELSIILQENFSGMRVVKAFASEDHEETRFDGKSTEVADSFIKAEQLRASSMSFMLFTFLVTLALVLLFGGKQVIDGNMTPGELAQFVFYLQILALPVRMAGWVVNSYARAASAGERMFEILDSESPVREKNNPKNMSRRKGKVVFENVSFSYNEDHGTPVLDNITIEANPGEVIALLGAPGSGKSTLINLLPRFYDVTSGRVLLDGDDIRDYDLKSLRENIGMVQQDVFLFTTTLRENICYGMENATQEEIEQAASVARMDQFIESLDDGYDTYIGERGSTLSGGQRQRMSIARAVLLDPPLLILDDSTSSVDAQTEDEIKQAMQSVMAGRTTFVIANRLSTVHSADKIIVLDEGRIIEEGTHEELLLNEGKYREIYELQLRPQDEVMREIDVKSETGVQTT